MTKLFILRFNLNTQFGTGHLFRAIALYNLIKAAENSARLHSLIFADDSLFSNYRHLLIEKNIEYTQFANIADEFDIIDKLLKQSGEAGKIIVLDIKDTTQEYMRLLKQRGLKIADFDDLGDGRDSADILIDANVHTSQKNTNNQMQLFGERYILLNPIFSSYNQKEKPIRNKISNLVMFFGGSDPSNIGGFILENYGNLMITRLSATLIARGFKRGQLAASTAAGSSAQLETLRIIDTVLEPREMAELYFNADIAIVSGGISLYETLCVGTPTITINHNAEQNRNVEYYKDYHLNLGIFKPARLVDDFNAALMRLSDFKSRTALSNKSKKIIDGLGYSRIIQAIIMGE